ncbi:antibiotic biosynthesis monooxygenase [Lactobacillus sp. CBA3605]|uniref:putative quinol monooxygenase n=1 Tax=Lactobacillus sp. CBA3605 TaxID=2099788 RepID=UPI000CFBCD43|nr:antibiotic biosynthesis monooxygenase [Lactobacillus sp. CBA3605]AVK61217.1 antibiotic biosynthesis monooxygenase [Lactobacillus sp. CBA3605]
MNPLTTAPLMRLFKLSIEPKDQPALARVGQHNLTTSIQQEAGTLAMYTAHTDALGADNIVIEVYRDDASYAIHAASEQFKAFREVAGQVVTQQQVTPLTPELLLEAAEPYQAINDHALSVRLVTVEVNAALAATFKTSVFSEMKQAMAVEPGVLIMYAARITTAPTKWVFFEVYQSPQAYDDHCQTAHFKQYLATTKAAVLTKTMQVLTPDVLVHQGGMFFENKSR